MTVATKPQTLEQIRDNLCKTSEYRNDHNAHQSYCMGVLDFYNVLKKQREAMDREVGEYKA
jgi:hypothetical protein